MRLLTNNPKKVEILTEAGINIVERVPLIVGRNPKNAHYLDTKAAKMGHLLNFFGLLVNNRTCSTLSNLNMSAHKVKSRSSAAKPS